MRPIEQVVYIRGTEDRKLHEPGTNRYYVPFPETWRTLAGRRLSIGVRSLEYHTGVGFPAAKEEKTPTDPIEYYNYGFSWNVCFVDRWGEPIPESLQEPFIYDVRYGFRANKYSPSGWLTMTQYGLQTQWEGQVAKWNEWLRAHGVSDDKLIHASAFEWVMEETDDRVTFKLQYTPPATFPLVPYFYNFFDYNWHRDASKSYFPLSNYEYFRFEVRSLSGKNYRWWQPNITLSKLRPVPSVIRSPLHKCIRFGTHMPYLFQYGEKEGHSISSSNRLYVRTDYGPYDGADTIVMSFFDRIVTRWQEFIKDVKEFITEQGYTPLGATPEWEILDDIPGEQGIYKAIRCNMPPETDSTKSYLRWPRMFFSRAHLCGIPESWYRLCFIDNAPVIAFTNEILQTPWHETLSTALVEVVTKDTYEIAEPDPEPQPTLNPTPNIVTTVLPFVGQVLTNYLPALISSVTSPLVVGLASYADYASRFAQAIMNGVSHVSDVWNNARNAVRRNRAVARATHSLGSNVTFKNATGIPYGPENRLEVQYTRNLWSASSEEEADDDEVFSVEEFVELIKKAVGGILTRLKKTATKEEEDAPMEYEVIEETNDDVHKVSIIPTATPISGSYPDFHDFTDQVNETDIPVRNLSVTDQTFEHQNGQPVKLPVLTFKDPLPTGIVETNITLSLGVQHNDSLEVTPPAEVEPLPTSDTSATITPSQGQIVVQQNPLPTAETSATIQESLGSQVVTQSYKQQVSSSVASTSSSYTPYQSPEVQLIQPQERRALNGKMP